MKRSRPEVLTLDVRPLIPSHRHPLIFAILEKLGEIGASPALQVVSDHELVGMRMELGMREETKVFIKEQVPALHLVSLKKFASNAGSYTFTDPKGGTISVASSGRMDPGCTGSSGKKIEVELGFFFVCDIASETH